MRSRLVVIVPILFLSALAVAQDRDLAPDGRPRRGAGDHSTVSWEAGEVSLREALARVTVGGNTTVLPLGLDDGQLARLPAHEGSYWSGIIAICRAFNLRVVRDRPDAVPAVDPWEQAWRLRRARFGNERLTGCRFGPVCLEAVPPDAAPPRYHANGLWLFEVTRVRALEARRLSGPVSWVEIDVLLHCEPGLERESIRGVTVGWTRVTAGDRQLQLGPPPEMVPTPDPERDAERDQQRQRLDHLRRLHAAGHQLPDQLLEELRRAGFEDADLHRVVVRGLAGTDVAVTITGQVQLTGRVHWEVDGVVELGGTTVLRAKGEAYELSLHRAVFREVDGVKVQRQPAHLLVKHVGESRIPQDRLPRARVVDAFGEEVSIDRSPRRSVGSWTQEYRFPLTSVDPGGYSVYLAGVHEGGVTVDRVGGTVELP